MTLVIDHGLDGAQVHVLAIGVGAYRHLPGGAGPEARETLGLGQLSGPPRSVMDVLDFVTSRLDHPGAPLGTVEVLLSPSTTVVDLAGAEIEIGLPDLAGVKEAFADWYDRCDSHPGNVAVFYFCGHGVQKDSVFLLLEDFGRSRLSLLENSVDITSTFTGMAACRARSQYFFVDACRSVPHQMLERLGGSACVLKDPEVVSDDRQGGLLFGTSAGFLAHGLPNRTTRFTEALIRSLDGLGSRPDGSRWVVRFMDLCQAVTTVMRVLDPDAPAQLPRADNAAGDKVMHVCPAPPLVPVLITCLPVRALQDAGTTAELTSLSRVADAVRPDRSPEGWQADVEADMYCLDVTAGPPYRATSMRLVALPPVANASVTVTS